MSKGNFKTDDKSLNALEYFEIIDLLEQNACSPVGKERCRQVRPHADLTEIRKSLSQIDELKRIEDEWGPMPPVDIQDARDTLQKTRVTGAVLDSNELIEISTNIQICQKTKTFFTSIDGAFPRLMAVVNLLAVCKEVGDEIRRCLNPDGSIRDEASPPLKRLRKTIHGVRGRIQKEMESLLHSEDMQPLLRDRVVTQRNGRAVLLVKPEFKRHIKGIVHDYSQSRMTLFVEPISVVEMNNDLNLLLDEEREEELRILGQLTEAVREKKDDLVHDLECLGELDLVSARMKLSRLLQGIQPEINETGHMRLIRARHPLLFHRKPNETVPVDIMLEPDQPVLVISGANAGGKTVALKTLGLLSLMVQSGMEIPVGEGSQIALYRRIFAEIGDEQSIGDDLSTFSAHLAHLNGILEKAEADSLVLVDEIGGGTNATEGAALAMGILDYLKGKRAAVVVTTHLEPLKGYGYVTPGVTNVGVEFDPETLQPKYRLTYGSSAPSHAFLVAEKMGFSPPILERAREYRHEAGGATATMIQSLEELQARAERERDQLCALQEEVMERRNHLDNAVKRIREKRDQILHRVEEQGKVLFRKTERELERLAHDHSPVEPGKRKPQRELREIENRFRSQVRRQKRKRSKIENLTPGEWVRILDLNREGIVSEVQKAIDVAEVVVGKLRIKTSLRNLERVVTKEPVPTKPSPPLSIVSSSSVADREANVVGLTVDEAVPIVDKFIDTALVGGLDSVTIIHGGGSGRLRDGIRDYLKKHRAVTGFRYGDPRRGGRGVTVVRLGWDQDAEATSQEDDHPRKLTADSGLPRR